jgi:hypothetical protein
VPRGALEVELELALPSSVSSAKSQAGWAEAERVKKKRQLAARRMKGRRGGRSIAEQLLPQAFTQGKLKGENISIPKAWAATLIAPAREMSGLRQFALCAANAAQRGAGRSSQARRRLFLPE